MAGATSLGPYATNQERRQCKPSVNFADYLSKSSLEKLRYAGPRACVRPEPDLQQKLTADCLKKIQNSDSRAIDSSNERSS